MAEKSDLIPLDSILEDFKTYVDIHNRGILSARFGDGKSFLISEFIKKYSTEYLFIPIYPVNYQIADNNEIMEYLKRDILIRLLGSGALDLTEETFSNGLLIYNYVTQNGGDIFVDILKCLSKLNIYGVDVDLKPIANLGKTIKSHKEKFKKSKKTETDNIADFISEFDKRKGSIYEFDWVTQCICDWIDKFKEQNEDRKVVLIIEDLDRIDPAHIFRILNVFSAHFDRYTPNLNEADITKGKNKFNFDKVITVCHYENIQNIYSHMYGKETDFNGYINKFAINKFNFSLKEGLKKWIVDNVKFSKEYPTISETLCEMIYSKYCTQPIAANLRKISEVIRTKPLFRENDIQLKDAPPLPCDTPFCRLLVWLMKFGLSYEDFKKEWKRHKYPNNELYIFIGYNWLLAPVVNNDPNIKIDCHFSELLDQTKIRVSYRDNGISFYITQISDAESYHQMQIFIQLDSLIAEFLYKEILINSH